MLDRFAVRAGVLMPAGERIEAAREEFERPLFVMQFELDASDRGRVIARVAIHELLDGDLGNCGRLIPIERAQIDYHGSVIGATDVV